MNESKNSKFVGEFAIDGAIIDAVKQERVVAKSEDLNEVDPSAKLFHNMLSKGEVGLLSEMLGVVDWVPVGINGMKQQGFDPTKDRIGSYRASAYSTEFAQVLWERIKQHFDVVRVMDEHTQTDWDGSRKWRPVGVNPLLRFIKYEDGGCLLPHYDAPFVYDNNRRTLMSLVLYIDRSPTIVGGATRYLKDPQKNVPVTSRNLDDWKEFAADSDVRVAYDPTLGSALLFDHRILHDSGSVHGAGQKLIMRTDIDFERADDEQ